MMRKKHIKSGILVIWCGGMFLIICIAFSRSCRRQTLENRREDQVRDMVEQIELGGGVTFVVDVDALPVAGEEEEWPEADPYTTSRLSPEGISEDPSENPSEDPSEDPSNGSASDPLSSEQGSGTPQIDSPDSSETSENTEYTLTAYGTISIPSIECEIPLWDGAGVVELRYGAGRMPLSCEAGESGNLVIFGHRMRRDGSLFNRLGQVVIGDTITILRNGNSYTYQVDTIETIEPSRLSYYMHLEEDGAACRITLITCTPIGVGTHRLVVIGHLVSS